MTWQKRVDEGGQALLCCARAFGTLWPFAPPYGHGHFVSSSFSPASGAYGHGAAQVASLVPVAKVVAV